MLVNLKAEMIRHRIYGKDIASFLNVREATISSKLNGKSDFSVNEAMAIQGEFFPNYSIEYLFKDVTDEQIGREVSQKINANKEAS